MMVSETGEVVAALIRLEQAKALYGKFLHLAVDVQMLDDSDPSAADFIRVLEQGIALLDEAKAAGQNMVAIVRDIEAEEAAADAEPADPATN
jgi:hypothetical protein